MNKLKKSLTAILGITLFSVNLIPNSNAAVRFPVTAVNGMVASDHYLASKAGADVLRNGGNAVDAAIATSLALSVIRNQSTGIGGGGFMVLHLANGDNKVIDYREVAPMKASRDMYLDADKKPVPRLSTFGYKAVGVPGNLAGLDYALKNYGTKALNTLMNAAIGYAENGFPADHHFVEASETVAKRGTTDELKKVFFNKNSQPYKLGEKVSNPELAETLKTISSKGIDAFYKGEIAQKIVNAMQENGGLISMEDLANYQPKIREPLKGTYRGYEIVTMPPPSSGGTVLLEILNMMEPYNIGWNSTGFGSSRHVHLLTEAMKHAYADRAEFLGDPDFVKVPVDMLTSKAYADKLRAKIKNHTFDTSYYGKKALDDDHGTTHYAVIDKWGNIVSATETVNTYFGSNVVIPGTGILMNNEMDDFSKQPGVPNIFGLIGNENNAIAPGKKPLSSMTPTIVLKDGKPFMVAGASGGPRIISGTLHAIMNVIDFGMNIEEAVSMPRFHHQWMPDKLFIEKEMPLDVRNNLEAMGHKLEIGTAESAVQALLFKDGTISGASDPRKGGIPDGF